jgi:hypothetical protein
MSRHSSFDEWIIGIATSTPTPGREDWARAMLAEFDALEGSRTGWALGCLGAAIGWRLKADGVYLLVFVATASSSAWLIFLPFFWASHLHLIPHTLSFWAFGYYRVLAPAGLCVTFAAIRPRLWMLVGLTLPITFVSLGVIGAALTFHSSIWDVRPFNAPLEIGMGAQIGYCLIGSLLGRSLGGRLARRAHG